MHRRIVKGDCEISKTKVGLIVMISDTSVLDHNVIKLLSTDASEIITINPLWDNLWRRVCSSICPVQMTNLSPPYN